jgi:hypothetical protein
VGVVRVRRRVAGLGFGRHGRSAVSSGVEWKESGLRRDLSCAKSQAFSWAFGEPVPLRDTTAAGSAATGTCSPPSLRRSRPRRSLPFSTMTTNVQEYIRFRQSGKIQQL